MKVTVSVWRTIIIHNDIDPFHVDPPTKDIRGDEDTLLERLKGGVAFDTIDQDMSKTINGCGMNRQLRTVPLGLSPSGC